MADSTKPSSSNCIKRRLQRGYIIETERGPARLMTGACAAERDPGRVSDFTKTAWFQVAYNDATREWLLLGLKTRVLSRTRAS